MSYKRDMWLVASGAKRPIANVLRDTEALTAQLQHDMISDAEYYNGLDDLRREAWELLEEYLGSPDELFFGLTGILVDGP